jgi:DNA-binding NtrC family response regulator
MSATLNLLIAEDDSVLISALRLMIPDIFKVYVTQSPDLVPDHIFFHAALVDMHLKSQTTETPDGPQVIAKLIKKNPQVEIISMSGHLTRENMEMAIKAGAQRFLAKPLSSEEVILVLEKIASYWQMRQFEFKNSSSSIKLIGCSAETEKLRKQIAQLKNEKKPILIEGETGTGKEVVAQLLHAQQEKTPFVTMNCSSVPENLFESELFGHIKGAFTGAEQNKIGLIEAAHGGDLFLDEIEALPLTQQAKLLRFLESGEIRKVGAKENQFVDVRVIVASNTPLKILIQEKKFREDLYFRISSQNINLTPLRERQDDINDLAQYFIDLEKPKRNKSWTPEALIQLRHYPWPGNVRELKRVCEQLVLSSPLPIIRTEDVERLLFSPQKTQSFESTQVTLHQFLAEAEKKFLQHHLQQEKNLDQVCQILEISKSNLYKKIKDYGITYE